MLETNKKIATPVGLILLLSVFIGLHLSQHQTEPASLLDTAQNAQQQWRQPPALDQDYSHQVGDVPVSLRFYDIEDVLKRIKFAEDGTIDQRSMSAKQLTSIISILPIDQYELAMQRLELLIHKSFSLPQALNLWSLIEQFYMYISAVNILRNDHRHVKSTDLQKPTYKTPMSKLAITNPDSLQTKIELLQSKYFSHSHRVALFQRSNFNARYIERRRNIMNDAALSEQQKTTALTQLQSTYQESLRRHSKLED